VKSLWRSLLGLSLLFVSMPILGGCAMMTPTAKPPSGTDLLDVQVLSADVQYSSDGTVTGVIVRVSSPDGNNVGAQCFGGAIAGAVMPHSRVCRKPAEGSYRAWWRDSQHFYLQGQNRSGETDATLFSLL